jgi:hypothetical protein
MIGLRHDEGTLRQNEVRMIATFIERSIPKFTVHIAAHRISAARTFLAIIDLS